MLAGLMAVVMLSVATAAISMTLTKAAVFKPMRKWLAARSKWLGKLFSCPYCASHWVATGLVLVYPPAIPLPLAIFVVVTLASPFAWLIYQSYSAITESEE